jgi:hypothetical protein
MMADLDQHDQHNSMDASLEDLLSILQLTTSTIYCWRESLQPESVPSDQLQELVTSVCFRTCGILANDTISTLSLKAMDQLADHVAALLIPTSSVNQNEDRLAPCQRQQQQHIMVIPLLQLLHSNLKDNQRNWQVRFGLAEDGPPEQQHHQRRYKSPSLALPFWGPSESIVLLKLTIPIVLGMFRHHPWKFGSFGDAEAANNGDYKDDSDEITMRMQLATFCNHTLEQVLTLFQQGDGADKKLEEWLQQGSFNAYEAQNSDDLPLSPQIVSQVVCQETPILIQWMRDYVIESMEYALDVVEGAIVLLGAASSSSTPLDPSARKRLWDDVVNHTRLALNASQPLLQSHVQQDRQHPKCVGNDIFLPDPIVRSNQQNLDRWISVLQSTWASYSKLVAKNLTNLDDQNLRRNTTDDLIRRSFFLANLLSSTPGRLSSIRFSSTKLHNAKATTLLRILEYPNITTSHVLQTLLAYWSDDSTEWKSLLQAAIMSRRLLYCNDQQEDPVVMVLIKAYRVTNLASDEDPWQALLMAKMAPYNVGTAAVAISAKHGRENQ